MDRTDLFNKIYEKTNLNPHSLNYLKKDLIERGEFLSGQIERVRQWHKERNADPIGCPEIGILTNEIIENDIQISIIEDELSRLESEKTKENTKIGGSGKSAKNRVLAFNNKTKGSLEDIKIILEDINSLLFENSNEYQWEQLLKGIKLDKPIIINKGITIKDCKYFINKIFTDYKILKGRIYTDLERIEAFLWNGDILTATQIQKVENFTDAKLKPQIDEILLKL